MQPHEMTPQPERDPPPDPTEEILYAPSSTPPSPPAPAPTPLARPRRGWTAPLLAAAFLVSTLAGGAVGGFAGAQWLAPRAQQTAPPAIATESPTGGTVPGSADVAASAGATVASTVYAQVKSSVVHIVVSGGGSGRGNGSGFVVGEGGYILTNQHVVANARTITVRFSTGETRQAQVVGSDRGNDIALLKVDLPAGVPAIALGDSNNVQVGELAIAIGSPFGLDQTVTQGIISAVNRTWQPAGGTLRRNLIQTDAPINPGNSGGPLLNAAGEVIGINSMIESPVEGSVGIGFAVAINVAKDLMPQLQAGARLEPVWLGISGIAIDQTIADDLDLTVSSGVLVASVVANGPAAKAGLRGGDPSTGDVPRGGDIILEIDGAPVASVQQVSARLQGHHPGENVVLTILRDGQRMQLTVTLEVWPADTN